jgi:hypothetical protein
MKPKYQYEVLIMLVLFTLMTAGCKKFIQIGPPNTEIATASVFDNSNAVTAALVGIYTEMFNNSESYNMAQDQGLLSDELTNYSTTLAYRQYYTNSMLAVDNTSGDWFTGYNYIYQANALIAGLQNNDNITLAIAQQITGEAKFTRAFWHFYLTNMYGAIPVVTSTAYATNMSIARTIQPQVYDQIIQDLTDAETLLNRNFVDATDTTITTDRVRPTKGAAEAMLARVYLYTQKYDSAAAEATLVINNTNLYSLCSNLSSLPSQPNGGSNSVFMMNSTEAIWQLYTPQPASNNTNDAQYFILTSAPGTGIRNSSTISPELLSSFEPGDLRRTNWIDSVQEPGITYYFPYKYQQWNTDNIVEYTMVLRLAEQYLIRAEAEANQGDSTDAITDLNTIRSRAGLPGYNPSINGPLLTAILHERQVELFTEWGHRWFDLNRTGAVNTVLGQPGNVYHMKGGTGIWNPDWELYPIPQSEILIDNHLTQNPGY